jgi:hypothetical protein
MYSVGNIDFSEKEMQETDSVLDGAGYGALALVV